MRKRVPTVGNERIGIERDERVIRIEGPDVNVTTTKMIAVSIKGTENVKAAADRTVRKARIQSAIEKGGNIDITAVEEIVDTQRVSADLGRLKITVAVADIIIAIEVTEVSAVAAVGVETTLKLGMPRAITGAIVLEMKKQDLVPEIKKLKLKKQKGMASWGNLAPNLFPHLILGQIKQLWSRSERK